MMNRTVPSVDYTGRKIYVSHTLAFPRDELVLFLEGTSRKICSAFEFMMTFNWKSSWGESEISRLIEEAEDLEASSLEAFYPDLEESQFSESQFPLGSLLAFDYSDEGLQIEPKKAAWKFENLTPEEMLTTFHRAWLCLDPWRGTGKYAGLIVQPQVTLRDSWRYSFTTNMRDGRPDAYQWAVLSAGCPTIPNRGEITPAAWEYVSPEEVQEKLGPRIGHLLVERCLQGPESWAQRHLREKLRPLQNECEEAVREAKEVLRKEWESIIQCVRDQTQKATVALNEALLPYRQAFDQERDSSEWRSGLFVIKDQARQRMHQSCGSFQQSAEPILRLINPQDLAFDPDCADVNFNDLQQDFNALVTDYQNTRPYTLMSESLWASKRNEAELLSDRERLEALLLLANDDREAELVEERKKLEQKFRSKSEEMEARLNDLTQKNKECIEVRRKLEKNIQKCERRRRRGLILTSTLFVFCLIGMYFLVKKQTAQNTTRPSEIQVSVNDGVPKRGEDKKQPQHTPEAKKE
jgi:Skp family chaperone for outer membrane proteins